MDKYESPILNYVRAFECMIVLPHCPMRRFSCGATALGIYVEMNCVFYCSCKEGGFTIRDTRLCTESKISFPLFISAKCSPNNLKTCRLYTRYHFVRYGQVLFPLPHYTNTNTRKNQPIGLIVNGTFLNTLASWKHVFLIWFQAVSTSRLFVVCVSKSPCDDYVVCMYICVYATLYT